MEIISQLLSPSPFAYVRDHAKQTGACLKRLQCQFEAALSEDYDAAEGHFQEIQSRVLAGRTVADELSQLLSNRLMLPVCREDIVETIDAQNQMLSACGECATLVSARSLPRHDETRQQLRGYVREVLELSAMAADIVAKVNRLVEVCFAGPEVDKVDALIDERQRRMTKTSLLRNRLVRSLFSSNHDVGPSVRSFCSCLCLLAEMRNMASLADKLTNRFRLFCPQQRPSVPAPGLDTRGNPIALRQAESNGVSRLAVAVGVPQSD